MVHWRERLWLAAFYPLEVLKARSSYFNDFIICPFGFVLVVHCSIYQDSERKL